MCFLVLTELVAPVSVRQNGFIDVAVRGLAGGVGDRRGGIVFSFCLHTAVPFDGETRS